LLPVFHLECLLWFQVFCHKLFLACYSPIPIKENCWTFIFQKNIECIKCLNIEKNPGLFKLEHYPFEEACCHHKHVLVFWKDRMSEHTHILGNNLIVYKDSQFSYKIKLSFYVPLLFTGLIFTSSAIITSVIVFLSFFFPCDLALSFNCEDFAFAEFFKHLDEQVVQKYCVF